MVIFQRRKVIAPLIALGRIFFNKPPPPGLVAEKRAGEGIPNMTGDKYKTAFPREWGGSRSKSKSS